MTLTTIKYKEWTFKVDTELTKQTYNKIQLSGSDTCDCSECKNYSLQLDNLFPSEIRQLFTDIGIDYKKEVEITTIDILKNGLHHLSGWFHFKGEILSGNDCKIPLNDNGYSIELTRINDNFSIGFTKGNSLTFFEDKTGLVQIEFEMKIPWIVEMKSE
jgi:hypothetical protein